MPPQADKRATGPGAIDEATVDIKPILDGASEYEYVEILNPLSVDFIAKFGVTKQVRGDIRIVKNPETPTITNDESDIRRNYGLDLRNKDHPGKANIISKVTIPAGQTIRVLGNEAQVIVNQLVTEILQRRKKQLMLADPTQRNMVEQEIIKRRDSIESILGSQPKSIQEQLESAVRPGTPEEEFPDLKKEEKDEGGIDPAPGKGATYTSRLSGGTGDSSERSSSVPAKAKANA